MAERIKLKISPAVAEFARPGLNPVEKLEGVEASAGMSPIDRVMLLFCLTRDTDDLVRSAASSAFEALPTEPLLAFIRQVDAYPVILDVIARFHHATPAVADALLQNGSLSPQAREFLRRLAPEGAESPAGSPAEPVSTVDHGGGQEPHPACEPPPDAEEPPEADAEDEEEPSAVVDDESDEFVSKFKLSQAMGVAEKIKMALTGDKEWRSILVKDINKLVSCSVIKNPRITEAEILTLVKTGAQNDEILRLICANKEWVKNYKIRKALVENPRTPAPSALRYLASLGEKDIAAYAKSKNVPTLISTQARRILLNKKR